MTDMTLIDKLERADGPDRELDQAIAVWHRSQISGKRVLGVANCAAYTASIDAAMTLVPEGMRHEIEITTLYQIARVGINLNHGPDDGPYYGSHEGNSIPLALCIAALRARSQGGE